MTRVVIAAALLLGGLTACGGGSGPQDAARGYLDQWSAGNVAAAAQRTDGPDAAMKALQQLGSDLHVARVRARVVHVDKHSPATASIAVTLTLRGVGDWTYAGRLSLTKHGGKWLVHWDTTDVNPSWITGTRLVLTRHLPARAPMLDRHGRPLFSEQAVVDIGLEPRRLGVHAATTIATVARVLKVGAASLAAAVKAAKPDDFVPVITLRRPAYDAVKPQIYSLPGTVFRTGSQLLAPTTGFARPLLGSVGPATADALKSAGPAYAAGDVLGLSGLQAVYQRRLAGTATTSVVVRSTTGSSPDITLKTFAGTTGAPVRTTLDIATQEAAEAALAREAKPAALVAVRASDGAILAAASTPDATSFDRALVGRYPPGSTFKVLTAYALLGAGVTPATAVACPKTISVGGRTFHNFEGESKGQVSFSDDFAVSCNTAFIGASSRLTQTALPTAAAAFGLGAQWSLPVDAFSGSVPRPVDPVDRAAEAIGQGRVQVSPLVMALVAAAVDTGTPHAPVLVTDPAQNPASRPGPLDVTRLTALRTMMRRVVTAGTAAPAHLPAATYGKTGTAEFGTANPPKTHAWFLGYRGGVAFAVLVEGGGVGGAVAAPIAARFLQLLGTGGPAG